MSLDLTGLAYLTALAVSLGGLALIDRRLRLAFWHAPRRSAVVLLVAVVVFLAWDVAGLALGIFARGDSPHQTGLLLAPELPVEEAVFLTLLSYTTLLAWRGTDRWWRRRQGVGEDAADGGGAGDGGAGGGAKPDVGGAA
ncbi:lycopene cyclase domain-containing protein [Sediminihabitans luteus]|uniref:Lycopene cyclase domain-containing protein n=1 Tax=Sediminihabitans luteus TaxID=1138585 RepID=A0A2M9D0I4_9CELL|nr:lycopene cyclase domain-containing protein [Sediminihabitans luteus]PJJ77595.1 lycopene cyclase domain-containing protein [Sediminihabitans luteus]GII98495.1 hypothetical protein Slu03_08730 [Sediminihabitans luteus]